MSIREDEPQNAKGAKEGIGRGDLGVLAVSVLG
jgi:hypothetical protein